MGGGWKRNHHVRLIFLLQSTNSLLDKHVLARQSQFKMSTITPRPTLDPDWTPTVYGCNRKGDFWSWNFRSENDQRTVLGGPSQTTNCLPSTWDPSQAYAGTQCPTGYTSACLSTGSAMPTTTVCCPTIYAFSCVENASKNPHGPWFPCMSQFDTSTTRRVTVTDFAANTITFQDVAQKTNLHLFAMGISHTSPTATDPADSSTTSSSPTSTAESGSSSAISAGAAAGIGVGSAAGVMMIGILGWFFLLRKKRTKPEAPPVAAYSVQQVVDTKASHRNTQPQELQADSARELPA
ncbi:hypothetical protein BDV26DRAFT_257933 [Aspergillus bertholletiae]|uniref:Mid2 domain-containing protein n=1 Tax=Aspergillus bertholletiae TaxID=1226010 RepID=A0A5N7BEM5_9EURO|nr:hypothetical protein BDV26DRAFT_257933 [Aspergillus bertholletiae]